MKSPLKTSLKTLKNLASLRYRAEQSYLDLVDQNFGRTNNKMLDDFVQSGIKMTRMMSDGRFNFERKLLDSFVKDEEDGGGEEHASTGVSIDSEAVRPDRIPSGTIEVTAAPGAKISVPLNITNHFDNEQDIAVAVSKIHCVDDKKDLKTGFKVANPNVKIAARSSDKVRLDLTLNKKNYIPGKQYKASLEVNGYEKRTFDLVVNVDSAIEKPAIQFRSPS